tara:strand:- start:10569 stop:10727 length:159 start_codon:yes stop_codon:yes gene_type:complete
MQLSDKTQQLVDNFAKWDKKKIAWFQKKFNLTDYQINWIAFLKGFIIGAIIL